MPNKDSLKKLMEFVEKADEWAVPSKDDELDAAFEETRRNWAKGKEAGTGFQRFGPVDHSKEPGSPENPRNVVEHWRDEPFAGKNLGASGFGVPRRFPVQREGGLSGPVTDATAMYGRRSQYDTETFPAWNEVSPSTQRERARMGMENSLRKEGDGGGAFDGLSDTVFTSTNAGIFTPTFGGGGKEKKHRKNKHRQDKKRKKLMGKEKKSGVERLVQYLYDGSPHIAKAKKMGLAPGLDDDMTGDGATAHAWNNQATGPMRLNHKKTSRPLEDALQTAENNEPHVNMGLAGNMEAGVAATYPRHDSVNSVGNAQTQRKPSWGKDNSYVQKAANEATTMTSPTENKPWSLTDPQDKFVERAGDNPNEPPAKDAVIKENDWEKRVKSYDDKASRRDGGQEQPAGSMAAAGMGGYPSGAAMQMSSFGSGPDTFAQDALARGGDKDMEDPEIAQEESDAMWIPEAEKVAKLEAMRKMLEDEGDETPLISALFAVDGE